MNTIVRHTRLSGLEPLVITPELLFVNVGDKLRVDTRSGDYITRA